MKRWRVCFEMTEGQYEALIHASVALELEAQDDESLRMKRDVAMLDRLSRKLRQPA